MKNNYLLTESLYSSISVYIILRKLMSDFKDWDAYKFGIIDEHGNKKKHPVTSKERESWDMLTRLCWNIKKIGAKFIGKGKFATYFTAAYLLKDSISFQYIEYNKEVLNEKYLNDITFAKQTKIFETFKTLKSQLPETSNKEETLELDLFKILHLVENVVELEELEKFLFEDGAPAPAAPASTPTVAGDIAQQAQYLIGFKRPIKKKKRKKYESN